MGIRTDWYGVPLNREQCPTLTCMHGGKDFTRLGSIAALRLSKAPDFSSYLLPKCRLGRFWSWKRRKISFYQGWHGLQDTVKAEEIALAWRIGLSRASSSTVWIILDAFVNMRERWARNPPMMMDTKSFCSKLHWEKRLRMKLVANSQRDGFRCQHRLPDWRKRIPSLCRRLFYGRGPKRRWRGPWSIRFEPWPSEEM